MTPHTPNHNGNQSQSQSQKHGHEHEHEHEHDEPAMAEMLDLAADVLASSLSEIINWVGGLAPAAPRRVVDVGAGTGTGSRALGRRFPTAEIVALDQSSFMLGRLEALARANGRTDRIRALQADLDDAWPDVREADVVWAALSMHHFADPDRVLRDIRSALNPDGLLAIVEMDAFPRFLPDDIGIGRRGLEQRCSEAAGDASWNTNLDWGPNLERSGFEIVEKRTFDMDVDPATSSLGRYAHASLRRTRSTLTGILSDDDVATLDRLLDEDSPESILRRTDLTVRGSRTAWAARSL
ncbi:class I SAM-dependent methyltransferase [Glaciibacter psychrotolerans]|uniref:SAM-dependent methyltransferase n=1 Tax=Glaciibacter psychrotolerans TaxID=670054 RepID=A0A7Z0ECK0_9MICO|nr:class I SAM-dependent methyltransferase [Leifsonia psychrotolerans]NYJ18685.1 SAM-dependent methyltransferase [Leifsonia psychrotolerans]